MVLLSVLFLLNLNILLFFLLLFSGEICEISPFLYEKLLKRKK
jgi:hypothetical protein